MSAAGIEEGERQLAGTEDDEMRSAQFDDESLSTTELKIEAWQVMLLQPWSECKPCHHTSYQSMVAKLVVGFHPSSINHTNRPLKS